MSCRDNNDGKKQKKDKGPAISSWDDKQDVSSLNSSIRGLDKKVTESNEGKKEKKDKGKNSGNYYQPLEEQQMRVINRNRGFDQHDGVTTELLKEKLNTNKKNKKN
ncbi:hypothetical protein MKX01_034163, partial [Papaver californicum]